MIDQVIGNSIINVVDRLDNFVKILWVFINNITAVEVEGICRGAIIVLSHPTSIGRVVAAE